MCPVTDIAFVGLGRMGLPMCAVLVETGYEVHATDERAEARAEAGACGASWRGTPGEAAAAAGVLITMLPGPSQVSTALTGPGGALPAMRPGATWIDMTSNSPGLARPIREQAIERGVQVLEAPVGGGPQAARQGRLQLFVGGDAAVLESSRPILAALADAIHGSPAGRLSAAARALCSNAAGSPRSAWSAGGSGRTRPGCASLRSDGWVWVP